jgi:hypothetical protein
MATIFLMVAINLSAQPDWSVNPPSFEYTMTITSIGIFDCSETIDENDIVGAFINNEVRGVQAFNTDVDGRKFAFLIIYDNDFSGNEVTFKLYDASRDKILDEINTVIFQENGSIGNVTEPFEFITPSNLLEISLSNDTIWKNELAGTSVAELMTLSGDGESLSAVYDFVNDSLGSDNNYFSISETELILENNTDLDTRDSFMIHIAVTAENGCTGDAVLIFQVIDPDIVSTVDPFDQRSMDVLIYPNPAIDQVVIKSPENLDYVLIYDSVGKLIHAYQNLPGLSTLDVSFLTDQLYYVLIITGKETQVEKLIINKGN